MLRTGRSCLALVCVAALTFVASGSSAGQSGATRLALQPIAPGRSVSLAGANSDGARYLAFQFSARNQATALRAFGVYDARSGRLRTIASKRCSSGTGAWRDLLVAECPDGRVRLLEMPAARLTRPLPLDLGQIATDGHWDICSPAGLGRYWLEVGCVYHPPCDVGPCSAPTLATEWLGYFFFQWHTGVLRPYGCAQLGAYRCSTNEMPSLDLSSRSLSPIRQPPSLSPYALPPPFVGSMPFEAPFPVLRLRIGRRVVLLSRCRRGCDGETLQGDHAAWFEGDSTLHVYEIRAGRQFVASLPWHGQDLVDLVVNGTTLYVDRYRAYVYQQAYSSDGAQVRGLLEQAPWP